MLCYLIPAQEDDDDVAAGSAGAAAAVEVAEQFRLAELILFFKLTHTHTHSQAHLGQKESVEERLQKLLLVFFFCFWDFF